MNKFGFVLGVAAVATLAGCKDPDYKYANASKTQTEVKSVDTTTTIKPAPAPKCHCAPGTKHMSPCMCGAPDCKCVVEAAPVVKTEVVPTPVAKPTVPAEPEYTIYVVQSGDYLAKISKKFNVTINSIKKLNPSIKKDVVRVGQKLKIPGKVDVGVQSAPAAKPTAAKSVKKATVAAYAGATKEYVVKNGDTLGSVAYGNGINIRQLKAMNGLTSDSLKVGQKLKIPSEKVAKKAAPAAKKAAPVAKKAVAAAKPAPAKEEKKTESAAPAAPVAEAAPAPASEASAPASEASAPAAETSAPATEASAPAAAPAGEAAAPVATTTYVVQEGDDMTGVSIRWGVSAAEIRELNNLSENDQLVPGQIIKLPAEAQQ